MPTVKVREKYQVTIPEEVREKIPLKVGERVQVTVRDGEIVIQPMAEVPRGQVWFWKEEMQKQVAKSIREIEQGKVKVFRSVKEAKKHFGD